MTDPNTPDSILVQHPSRHYLVLNGPNLNLLGEREPGIYGDGTLGDLEHLVRTAAREMGVEVDFLQSNHEGVLIDTIQSARLDCDGIVYNPGAHTHYSYALRDAVAAIRIPVVEVHISDIMTREPFRQLSVIAPVCVAQVKGEGFAGYVHALHILTDGI
jgi:3-dehydroquinate dehydratase-2